MDAREMKETFGNVIYQYTSRQAIEDGVLVEPFPDKFPGVLLTIGVHEAIVENIADGLGRTYAQAVIPLLMDAVMVVKSKPREHLWTKGLEGNVTGKKVWITINDLHGLTLMFPEEY